MKKWEYKIVELFNYKDVVKMRWELNILGNEGWEVIAYCPNIGGDNGIDRLLILKREKSQE